AGERRGHPQARPGPPPLGRELRGRPFPRGGPGEGAPGPPRLADPPQRSVPPGVVRAVATSRLTSPPSDAAVTLRDAPPRPPAIRTFDFVVTAVDGGNGNGRRE